MIGATLGEFEIREPLGSGGMGEVYRAWDTRLERDVAIKLLPEEFANDADRLGRFEREAKLLASLSHPNISGIYGLEEADGKLFLSLEFVPGVPLAARIKSKRLHIREALEIARQIADALEAAHRDGIIHRDLKPSNVMITPDGTAKVLDFGLGKAFSSSATSDTDAEAPTESSGLTSSGLVVGTVPYMSPEQARGFAVDKRTDIWSFGCVLYEALTGRRAFEGDTQSDTIVAVLEHEPAWKALPAKTPARIIDLLRRCLNKDPTRRLRHIGDAKLEIEEAVTEISGDSLDAFTTIDQRRPIDWWRTAPWLVAGAAVLIAALAIVWGNAGTDSGAGRGGSFTETLPSDERLFVNEFGHPFALSPDGQYLAYAAYHGTGASTLRLRHRHELEARKLPGTDGARSPFFSPDGRWIGFFADGRIRKVSIEGGLPSTLCDTVSFFGAAWLDDDTIVFSDATRLLRVSADGGTPMLVVSSNVDDAEYFDSPVGLPGGEAVLVTATTADEGFVEAVRLDTGTRKRILPADYPRVAYARSGYLIYGEAGTIFAIPFDVEELAIRGASAVVREDVDPYGDGTGAIFALSEAGTLVYVPNRGTVADRRLVWSDRESGDIETVTEEVRWYTAPRISPNGRQIAVTIVEHSRNYNVWIYDLDEGRFRRLTFEGNNEIPVWSPDGSRVAFLSYRDGLAYLYSKAADGTGSAELLLGSEDEEERAAGAGLFRYPSAWSPDGRQIAYFEATPDSQWDVFLLSLEDRRSTPQLSTGAGELSLKFSRTGDWIAYVSDASGRHEVYVEPFPATGAKYQVSDVGGISPIWAPDGSELFFDNGRGQIMAARIQTSPVFSAGTPRPILDLNELWTPSQINSVQPGVSTRPVTEFDLSPDGERFLIVSETSRASSPWKFAWVLDWSRELDSLVSRGS
jgi:serine/threonine protein kinase/Tol biopolymer transport system component